MIPELISREIQICPCGSKLLFSECCSPIISGKPAPTAEALVRSRYSAFATKQLDYVERTHAPEVRSDFNRAEAERLAEDCQWQSLSIHRTQESQNEAEVDYVVQVKHEGRTVRKGASSKFRREDGEWLYVSNKPAQHLAHLKTQKVGRNDPCPCGSGSKFKKCCDSHARTEV